MSESSNGSSFENHSSLLERFENRNQKRDYLIRFKIPEFTCLCPRSGFPDFATIFVEYIPKEYCMELKSLKMYVAAYRNKGIFHEDVANQILDDLMATISAKYMKVYADFNVRGNIHTTVTAIHGEKNLSC